MKDQHPEKKNRSNDKVVTRINDAFHRFAQKSAQVMGSPLSFILAITIVAIWGLTGPLFGFSDTWQLVINTGTTIITFLMVFVIQNTQNRDSHTMQLKLDELLRALKGARNDLIDLESCNDEQLAKYEAEFARMRKEREQRKQAVRNAPEQ